MQRTKPRIVVVGAGIVGASIVYHLAQRGASVTVVDATGVAAGATGRAFGWINIASGASGAYSRLRQPAAADWRRLEEEFAGALGLRWCGALTWHRDPAETERFVADRLAEGYGVRLVGREEVATLEPGLADPPRIAAHAAEEGMLDPVRATGVLLRAAEDLGAEMHFGASVQEVVTANGRVWELRTEAGEIAADCVVLACGVGARSLLGLLGADLPLHGSPAILLRYRTPAPVVRGIVSAPGMEVRQGLADILVGAANYVGEGGEDSPEAVAARALATVRRSLRGGHEVTLLDVAVGVRPMPADRLPVVGPLRAVEGVYLAALHSGVTMAAIVGRLVAEEIKGGHLSDLLQPFRPERFAEGVSA
ncbi:NAD(P)/FAD-dependent oxidoreductase (plasmid) [Roseomonas sp. CCTCC AB2023176]|uniref:NAD(P)/FAD-dependent oxidoreductase n=1 Tax=Roseomonas sp. CCTCC AB2023176 TaxID=3342640 RepID=UPI0035D7A792